MGLNKTRVHPKMESAATKTCPRMTEAGSWVGADRNRSLSREPVLGTRCYLGLQVLPGDLSLAAVRRALRSKDRPGRQHL